MDDASTFPPPDRAYLIVTKWPRGADEEDCISGLVRACAIDAFTARDVCRRGVPTIARRISTDEAPIAAKNLAKLGFGGDWVSQGELVGRVPVRKVKRMMAALGAPKPMYFVEFWREKEGTGLLAQDIRLIVRGRVRYFTASSPDITSTSPLNMKLVPLLNIPSPDSGDGRPVVGEPRTAEAFAIYSAWAACVVGRGITW